MTIEVKDIGNKDKELSNKDFIDLITQGVSEAIKELEAKNIDRKGVVFSTPKTDAVDIEKLSPKEKLNKFFVEGVFAKNGAVVKALGGGTGSTGGFLVPTEFAKAIITELPALSPIRAAGNVFPVGGAKGDLPKTTAKPTYSWGSENTDFAESDPTLGQLTWSLNRLNILTKFSQELATDAVFDVGAYLKKLFVEQFAAIENAAFTNGTGTGQPEGFRIATGITSVVPTVANTIGYNDIVALLYAIPAAYRAGASFITSTLGMERIKQIKDTTGRPIFDPNSSKLMGKNVIENPDIPENLTNGAGTPVYDATEVWVGNFKFYYIFDSGQFEIKSTEEGAAMVAHQIWLASSGRLDGKVALTSPFAKLENLE